MYSYTAMAIKETENKIKIEAQSEIRLHNTLSGKTEVFKPMHADKVSMYHCGPTVYNYLTIGNLRAYVMADLLRRTFEANGYAVKQVINITDVGHLTSKTDEGLDDDGEDKVEKMAHTTGKTATEISEFFTKVFFDDIHALNIKTAGTLFPKATEHIKEQLALIQELEKKGHTYQTSDGIYFDTSTFPEYGKLGSIDIQGLMEGARIQANSEKRNVTDFALWKFSPKNEKRSQEWESPWGVGFPGWHIECSAMSEKYLGKTFDIHTGGIDHIPVHHNNEIAQSESANGVPLAHYWLHNAFVTIDGNRMGKSKGNFLRIETLMEDGISPLAYRYWLMNARYSSPVQFSLEAVKAAEQGYKRLLETLAYLNYSLHAKINSKNIKGTELETGKLDAAAYEKFLSYMNDDLDTPKAIAYLPEIISNTSISDEDKKATILACDELLGLNLMPEAKVPDYIIAFAEQRKVARASGDFARSDELRKKIEASGFKIKDLPKNSYAIIQSVQ